MQLHLYKAEQLIYALYRLEMPGQQPQSRGSKPRSAFNSIYIRVDPIKREDNARIYFRSSS